MYRTDFWTLWEKARVGCFKRTALKHVCYLGWNRSPAQVGCMRQVLGPGALGRPRGIGQRGRWEGVSEWGIHVKPWLIHVNVWQKPLQYCKVISLQLIKKKKKKIVDRASVNYGPQAKSEPHISVNKVSLGHIHAHLLIYCVWLLYNNRILCQSEVFTILPFTGKPCQPMR